MSHIGAENMDSKEQVGRAIFAFELRNENVGKANLSLCGDVGLRNAMHLVFRRDYLWPATEFFSGMTPAHL